MVVKIKMAWLFRSMDRFSPGLFTEVLSRQASSPESGDWRWGVLPRSTQRNRAQWALIRTSRLQTPDSGLEPVRVLPPPTRGRVLLASVLSSFLFFGIPIEAKTGEPPVTTGSLPDSFHLVYEVTPGDPSSVSGSRTSRLEAWFQNRKGRLDLNLASHGKKNRRVNDPWKSDEVAVLWQHIVRSDLFKFRAQQGPSAPDFGIVSLSCEAFMGGKALSTRLQWTSPLRNDGPIWPLINYLDTLMAGPSPFSPQVSSPSTVSPAPQSSPLLASSPDPIPSAGEIEMLISLEATHLPLSSDEIGTPIQKTQRTPLVEGQRAKILRALDVLGERQKARPNDAELCSLRGAFFYDLGEFEKARHEFDGAIRLQPHQADHYNNRGMAFLRQGKKDEAINDFRRAIRRNRGRYGLLDALIQALKAR